MKRWIFFVFVFFTFSSKALYFPSDKALQNVFFSDSSSLYFHFINDNLFWNNEFFNPIVEGYTLLGYHVEPTLEYHFTPNIKVNAGIHLLKYFGVEKYSKILPIYTVTWHNDHLAFVMGTIHGASFHQLPDQIMNAETQWTDNVENGAQILYSTNRIFADVWVNWKTFIFPNDNKQEEIFAGISAKWTFLQQNGFELKLPVSLIIYHKGGQIDTLDRHLKTLVNYTGGLVLSHDMPYRFLDKLSLEMHAMGYADNSPSPESIYQSGVGYQSSLKLHSKQSYLSVGYWYADHFLSIVGNPIYQCYSTVDSTKHAKYRQLVTAEVHLSKQIVNYCQIALMANSYFDIKSSQFDYSYGVSITLQPQFFIRKFKPSVN
jgi:hypothetical protein